MWKGLGESGGDWHLALGAGSPDAALRARLWGARLWGDLVSDFHKKGTVWIDHGDHGSRDTRSAGRWPWPHPLTLGVLEVCCLSFQEGVRGLRAMSATSLSWQERLSVYL